MKQNSTTDQVYCLSWNEFPQSFRDEFEVYLFRRADPDALMEWSYAPLNPNSLPRFQLFVKEYAVAQVH